MHDRDTPPEFDYVIIGSGFGGSVSALRLVEKGYRVLVLEKGKRLGAEAFPLTNWNLKRWLWMPALNWAGPFKMTFLRHITVFSGVGVGGGSLVYANTLPIPLRDFYYAPSWAHLANWQQELAPHYVTARYMLGAAPNRHFGLTDQVMREVAEDLGLPDAYESPHVGVYQGRPGLTVADPYFGGQGPTRTGCIQCGGCMLGCRYNAKNTLDKNYLYLAEAKGLQIWAETEAASVAPLGGGGYEITLKSPFPWRRWRGPRKIRARNVIFAGGVLGTVPLLLRLKQAGLLPALSEVLGRFVRTNNESITGVLSQKKHDFSQGIAISSIVNLDPHSHVEPVRYSAGSSFFRLLMAPHGPGNTVGERLRAAWQRFCRHPTVWMRFVFGPGFSERIQMLLYMRSLEGSLVLERKGLGSVKWLASRLSDRGVAPKASIAQATDFAERFAGKVDGIVGSLATETLAGIPSTAHILGGCCMGDSVASGVINHKHEVFGYPGLMVIDGSAVSANPGVNPSLTITALAERAMSFIPSKGAAVTATKAALYSGSDQAAGTSAQL